MLEDFGRSTRSTKNCSQPPLLDDPRRRFLPRLAKDMSFGKAIETPHTLASLPPSVHGRTLASIVYGLRGSRKRKRTEVAVSVDGEGVNIYNVRLVIRGWFLVLNPCAGAKPSPCRFIRLAAPDPLHGAAMLGIPKRTRGVATRHICLHSRLGG